MKTRYKRFFFPGCVFFVIFLSFLLRNHYYPAASLEITATCDKRIQAIVQWDTGDGFNDNETQDITLGNEAPLTDTTHTVKIERIGQRNNRAGGTDVLIVNVKTDKNKVVALSEVSSLAVVNLNSDGISKAFLLQRDGDFISFDADFSALEIVFLSGTFAGKAQVTVDDDQHVFDLYSPVNTFKPIVINKRFVPGQDVKTVTLPQLKIKGLLLHSIDLTHTFKLNSLEMVYSNGRTPLQFDQSKFSSSIGFGDIEQKKQLFHPVLVCIQLLLALLISWLSYELAGLKRRLALTDWRSVLTCVFVQQRLWIFWVFFLVSTGVFSLWLMAYWPGTMTNDSFDQWVQQKTLTFSNWHPYIYALGLAFLDQIFDSPASLAMFQLLSTAALGSCVFWFAIREGVRFYLVLPFFIAFVLSIPVGLYNISMWKDIPFSVLTSFFAFILFLLAYNKKAGRPVTPTWKAVSVTSVMFAALCLVRHNGIIFLFFLPLLLWILKLIPNRWVLRFSITSLILFVFIQYIVASALSVHSRTNYNLLNVTWKLGPILALFNSKLPYYSDNYEADAQMIQKYMSVEEIKDKYNYLNTAHIFFSKFSDGNVSYDGERLLNRFFIKRVADNMPMFFSERAFLIFSAFGYKYTSLWGNDLYKAPKDRDFIHPITARLNLSPRSMGLFNTLNDLVNRSSNYAGVFSARFWIWNPLIPLVAITTVFLLYKWLPITALSCLFVLFQVPFLFLTIQAPDFRYMYFIYLFAYMLFPLLLIELHSRKNHGGRDPL
ncbi:membrane protein [Candidatus Magnetobacterium bavaricum]|uniref:Membrane protein n=1 Tax=Candidatus Magnetobacterium bavaricum TaxID=29290 RepID=A0A0F3GWM1_9BACT|nr:membrane protein [Candidatus Magnetobacterium bavaricum]